MEDVVHFVDGTGADLGCHPARGLQGRYEACFDVSDDLVSKHFGRFRKGSIDKVFAQDPAELGINGINASLPAFRFYIRIASSERVLKPCPRLKCRILDRRSISLNNLPDKQSLDHIC